MTRKVTLALAGAVALAAWASPARAQLKPEEMVRLRQGLMIAQKSQVGPMGAVAKGEAQMSDATATQAANLAAIARVVPIGFGAESQGASGVQTKAKPEIWKNSDDFKQKAAALQAETAKLAEVAKGKDVEKFKAQFAATTATCKACHDAYRAQ